MCDHCLASRQSIVALKQQLMRVAVRAGKLMTDYINKNMHSISDGSKVGRTMLRYVVYGGSLSMNCASSTMSQERSGTNRYRSNLQQRKQRF